MLILKFQVRVPCGTKFIVQLKSVECASSMYKLNYERLPIVLPMQMKRKWQCQNIYINAQVGTIDPWFKARLNTDASINKCLADE